MGVFKLIKFVFFFNMHCMNPFTAPAVVTLSVLLCCVFCYRNKLFTEFIYEREH